MASCPIQDADLLKDIDDLGCKTTHNNLEVVEHSDVVILSVKPMILPKIIKEIRSEAGHSKLLVSIAAGVKIQQMQEELMKETKVRKCYII